MPGFRGITRRVNIVLIHSVITALATLREEIGTALGVRIEMKPTLPLRPAIAIVIAVLSGLPLFAQEGQITGRVIDATNGEPMTRATVRLLNTTKGTLTNTSGTYTLSDVSPGTYSLKISYIGYAEKVIEGVVVSPGRTVRQDITLSVRSQSGTTITVTGKIGRQTESAALIERRRSASVDDAISAQEISRAPAGDAGDAMRRVTGVSVVGSRYVVVRGLTERYSATQLNGVNLPSPEPEKKVVPFDMFPSSMISRLTTVKTFTPDNPGDFAGGLVKISTRDYPESFLLGVSLGSGFNSETVGTAGLAYAGGGTDYLGVDDGTRALPAGLQPGRRTTSTDQANLLRRFTNNVWTPTRENLGPSGSFNISVGDRYDIGMPIGFLLSTSYSRGAAYRQEEQRLPLLSVSEGTHDLRFDYDAERTEVSTIWGGLLNLSAQPAPEHKVSFKAVYNHNTDDETRQVTGLYNQSTTGDLRYTRLRYLERTLASYMLSGEHQVEGLGNSKIEWRGSLSTASRYEPDNRSTTYLKGLDETAFRFVNNFGSNNGRFFSDLNDREISAGLDWMLPIALTESGPIRAKFGGLGRFRNRDFTARRFVFTTNTSDPAVTTLAPESLFTPENVEKGLIVFNDETQSNDRYDASETINAGYAMVDFPISGAFRLIAGARFEDWAVRLTSINPLTEIRDTALAVERGQSDVLPSLNLVYSWGEEMNVRGSFSQTLARPEFRELAPFRFDDYRQSTYGNPALERTRITNYDIRWEWFPGPGEVVAVSAFYKSFINPIEQVYLIGSGISVEPANAHDAMSSGLEFEFRKGLEFLDPSLAGFSVGGNLTLVSSEVTFTPGEFLRVFDGVNVIDYGPEVLTSTQRALQGQSPYVVNLSLGYDNAGSGTSATLLYNSFGERIALVGTEGIPDTYEQARPSLDLSLAQRLPLGLQVKLSAKNLLNNESRFVQRFESGAVQETIVTERYITGRSFSIGLGFSFDQLQSGQ